MSALTGNQIKDSYQGLLKLADSSTGITNSLQAIQDGLGNNTGLRIATNQLETENLLSYIPLKAQYYGSGFAPTAPQQLASGTQNVILAYPFYDNGNYDYSAITFNVITATTSSDTCEAAIYTTQLLNPNGLFPHAPIVSGLTVNTTPVGTQTITFPSNISMSGYGAGIYWLVFKISNSGVQPTVRFGGNVVGQLPNLGGSVYGLSAGLVANQYGLAPYRLNGSFQVFSGQTTFDNPFGTNLPSLQSTTQTFNGANLGFLLHTTNY